MPEPPHLSRSDAADLAAFVDGRLSGRRLARFEARLERDAALASEVDRQRRALRSIDAAVAATAAPTALRHRVDALQPARPARRRRSFLVPSLGAAAVLAIVLTVVLAGAGGPTVDDALAFASRDPVEAVTQDPRTPQLLEEAVEGVRFPDYEAKFGWEAVGKRTDALDDQAVTTVFYERGDVRIAYSIIGGEALDEPDGPTTVSEGTEITSFADDAVTWRRQGHTCVLSGTDESTLNELAGWKGQGNVEF